MDYQFSVVELPEKQIAGIYVQTNMKNAATDCPTLWQSFGPRICGELSSCSSLSKSGDTYGVSVMTDENNFTYWAAVGVDAIHSLPEDMKTMTITQGLYVKCTIPGLEQMGEAFMAMYTQWPQSQNEYVLDMGGACFELYPKNWQLTDSLEIYAKVIKK